MSWSKEFVKLDKIFHDRNSFDCGEDELNIFIKTKADKHMETGISRTMVLPSSAIISGGKYQICSFYSIAPSAISKESLPQDISKKLPSYPVPVFLLAQLTVHSDYKGKGLGKITLLKSLEYLWRVNHQMNAFAIVVDCLNESAKTFYLKYEFNILYEENNKIRMFIAMKVIEKLADNLGWKYSQ